MKYGGRFTVFKTDFEEEMMAVFQCKMCAGNLNFEPGDTICTCDYCGTKQTLPRIDSDQKSILIKQ